MHSFVRNKGKREAAIAWVAKRKMLQDLFLPDACCTMLVELGSKIKVLMKMPNHLSSVKVVKRNAKSNKEISMKEIKTRGISWRIRCDVVESYPEGKSWSSNSKMNRMVDV